MNGERKSTGDRLKLDEVNALLATLRGSSSPSGIAESGRQHQRPQQSLSRARLVDCVVTGGDIPAYSIFAPQDSGDVDPAITVPAKSRRVLLRVGPLDGQRCSPYLLCTEEVILPGGKQGLCRPVTPWEPTLVRITDTEDDQPARGDYCGIVRGNYVATKRLGGLLCVASGLEVNVAGVAKKIIAVVPCPGVWWWGKVGATVTGGRKVRVTQSYGVGTVPDNYDLWPVVAPTFLSHPPTDTIVQVIVCPWTGKYTYGNVIGCGVFPPEE